MSHPPIRKWSELEDWERNPERHPPRSVTGQNALDRLERAIPPSRQSPGPSVYAVPDEARKALVLVRAAIQAAERAEQYIAYIHPHRDDAHQHKAVLADLRSALAALRETDK